MTNQAISALPSVDAEPLLRELACWRDTTTVILHGGCVFEFKGVFPPGEIAHGFYNLEGPTPGFHGHLRLSAIARVGFQDKPHRGRSSYAFTFDDADGGNLFKVFLGRDATGEVFPEQLAAFNRIRSNLTVTI